MAGHVQRRPRSLRDLGILGRTVSFPDPEADGGRQVVWLQKLNPAEQTSAVKKANAARARARLAYQDRDSDEYLDLLDNFNQMLASENELVDLLIAEDVAKLQQSVEAELELGTTADGEPTEWGRDGYLEGLREAWMDHGREAYVRDQDDPEAQRILLEFARFTDEVEAILGPQVEDLRAQTRQLPKDAQRDRGMERFIHVACERAWIDEFERSELWLGTRRPCDICAGDDDQQRAKHSFVHDDFYFANRDEIDGLTESVRDRLLTEFHYLTTEILEGKGLPGNPASSDSSESPAPPATEPASGREVATA